jgi:benzoylformate decarboxylase
MVSRPEARQRIADGAALREREQAELLQRIDNERTARPMTARTLMHALARVLPENAAVIEEAPTTHHNMLETLGVLKDPTGHFAHRGWALGWGPGCAIGVKLAWPHRPVAALIGDGAALYGIQAVWTAAKYRVPVVFVIANNSQYKILKSVARILPLPAMAKGNNVGMDLGGPAIDFVGLARSFGVEAHRVAEPDELSERVRAGLQAASPILFEVPIER